MVSIQDLLLHSHSAKPFHLFLSGYCDENKYSFVPRVGGGEKDKKNKWQRTGDKALNNYSMAKVNKYRAGDKVPSSLLKLSLKSGISLCCMQCWLSPLPTRHSHGHTASGVPAQSLPPAFPSLTVMAFSSLSRWHSIQDFVFILKSLKATTQYFLLENAPAFAILGSTVGQATEKPQSWIYPKSKIVEKNPKQPLLCFVLSQPHPGPALSYPQLNASLEQIPWRSEAVPSSYLSQRHWEREEKNRESDNSKISFSKFIN